MYTLMNDNEKYLKVFAQLGSQLDLQEEVIAVIEDFTCWLYLKDTKIQRVNN